MTESQSIKLKSAIEEIEKIVSSKFKEETDFTGKILFELNCNQGNIGNIQGYSVRKIKNS